MMTTPPNKEGDGPEQDRMSSGTKVGIAATGALGSLVVALLILGALAPTSTARSDGTAATSTSAATVKQADAVMVDVQAGEYFFKSAVTAFKVGVHYHFVVHNDGAIPHEFMLVQSIAPGMMSMEQMDNMAIGHIESSNMQAHQDPTIDVTFTKPYPAGALEMACHVGQHYENGMRLPIVVTS
jgi:uncharacterized cupredoxin-like copper-binding protein